MNRRIKIGIVAGGIALLVLGILAVVFSWGNSRSSVSYRMAPITREDLQVSVSATGTVQPEELVDVGAQVAGKIVEFGKDEAGRTIDYGSIVEEGTVLAQIDDSLYAADVALAEAQLGQALAGVERAEADMVQLQARFLQAQRDWNRARKLGPSEALSQSAYDAALSAHDVAKANVAVGKASIDQAKKTVAQARATLERARRNLDYCIIKSPVNGIIIDRRVNIGQTVVASLNAPSLFLIARDLKRLQVWVPVNEADIGSIRPEQAVVFTVDAFPDEVFQGQVGKIRLNATMTQNVVTYIVEVNTDNSSGRLLPYLTANLNFIVSERNNVLTVPNAALRWTPEPQGTTTGSQGTKDAGNRVSNVKAGQGSLGEGNAGTLWVQEGGSLRSISVKTGLSDGVRTEVEGEGVSEGMQVVIGEPVKGAEGISQKVNPFTPRLPGRGPRP